MKTFFTSFFVGALFCLGELALDHFHLISLHSNPISIFLGVLVVLSGLLRFHVSRLMAMNEVLRPQILTQTYFGAIVMFPSRLLAWGAAIYLAATDWRWLASVLYGEAFLLALGVGGMIGTLLFWILAAPFAVRLLKPEA